MEKQLTENDYNYIKEKGISIEKVKQQLYFYENGIPKIVLEKPATISDGIITISKDSKSNYISLFKDNLTTIAVEKFVPASGAASRMFKFLSEFLSDFKPNQETINAYINRSKNKNLEVFFVGLKNFPFYKDLVKKAREVYPDFDSLFIDQKRYYFVKLLFENSFF